MSSVTLVKTDDAMESRKLTTSLAQASRSLTALDVLLLALAFSLFFMIFTSSHLLPLNATLHNNSDFLFIEEVARDLNAGGNLFDWRLTQAPYLFPDIVVARVLAAFLPGVGQVGVYYLALFGVAMLGLIFWLCRLSRVPAFIPLMSTALLYSTAYIAGLSGDIIPVYFGLIGHHCGVVVTILLACAAVILFIDNASSEAATLSLLYFSAFAGVISDSLFIVAFVPVLFAYALLALARKEITAPAAGKLLGITLLAVALGKAFGYTNPFPQDREYMQGFLALFPALTPISFKTFGKDFVDYVMAGRISAFIAAAYFLSAFAALIQLTSVLRRRRPAKSAITFISVFVLLGPLMTILAQNIVGLYVTIHSSRQWAGIVLASIAFGAMIIVHLCPSRIRMQKLGLAVIQLIILVHVSKALAQNKGVTKDASEFVPIVSCMKENHLPPGSLYVADYWIARPLRMYSQGEFGVSPYGGLMPIPNASNIAKTRKATPRFIITGMSVQYNEVVARFGPPRAEYCATTVLNGVELKVLDYSESVAVKDYLRNNAVKLY